MHAEFSRIVDPDDLSAHAAVFDIEATEAERGALAARFGLEAIERLAARVRLKRIGRSEVMFSADILADIVQICILTLEPVAGHIEDRVALRFGPAAQAMDADGTAEISVDDEFEPLPDGTFDIGEIVAGEFSLLLDPYPRQDSAAAAPENAEYGSIREERPDTAFRALAGLWRKD